MSLKKTIRNMKKRSPSLAKALTDLTVASQKPFTPEEQEQADAAERSFAEMEAGLNRTRTWDPAQALHEECKKRAAEIRANGGDEDEVVEMFIDRTTRHLANAYGVRAGVYEKSKVRDCVKAHRVRASLEAARSLLLEAGHDDVRSPFAVLRSRSEKIKLELDLGARKRAQKPGTRPSSPEPAGKIAEKLLGETSEVIDAPPVRGTR